MYKLIFPYICNIFERIGVIPKCQTEKEISSKSISLSKFLESLNTRLRCETNEAFKESIGIQNIYSKQICQLPQHQKNTAKMTVAERKLTFPVCLCSASIPWTTHHCVLIFMIFLRKWHRTKLQRKKNLRQINTQNFSET